MAFEIKMFHLKKHKQKNNLIIDERFRGVDTAFDGYGFWPEI